MKRREFLFRTFLTSLASVAGGSLLLTSRAEARTYMTPGEAAKLFWGTQKLTPVSLKLTREQKNLIKERSGISVLGTQMFIWKTESGGWFVLDAVIGKHEFIDYAVALEPDGTVKAIEILVYREGYGDAVVNEKWRRQFYGLGHKQPIRHEKEILNISGATMSCVHITEGVRRLVHLWDIALRHV